MHDGSSWQRSVIAGNTEQAYVDGSFNEARFSFPGGLAVGPDGNIYVEELYEIDQ